MADNFEFQFVLFENSPLENHETTTFRASLELRGPRDCACGKEREILFRIALTRALYDQMAPQLCHFYVPRKLRSFSSSFLRFSREHAQEGGREHSLDGGREHSLDGGWKQIPPLM